MEEKHFKTEDYCPNLIYENEYFALGVLKTWDEYKNHPMADAWNYEQKYFEENINKLFYYFVCLNKNQAHPYRCLLIMTDFTLIGNPLWYINENGEKTKAYHYDPELIEEMRAYLIKEEHQRKEKLRKEKEAQKKTESEQKKVATELLNDVNYVEHAKNTIEDIAYVVSSEEFQFKTLKRNIIDHGKNCYIKGYKQHETDFERFLLHHGYFSIDELSDIRNEFNTFQTDIPELTLETVERYINTNGDILAFKDGRYVKQTHVELTDVQKDVFKYYTELTNETPILRIQKPRAKGISTILKIIAQIEALGGKNVLYAGFDMCTDRVRKIKNLTYYRLHSYSDVFRYNLLFGKHYDLIIIDEMTAFKMPYEVHDRCVTSLTENGRMIIVGTPPHCNNSDYRELKKYFKHPYSTKLTDTILYIIEPSEEDREKAEKYPDCRNETLGEFFD